ncbi:uncharacterized protein V6R79_012403 [Siganus canaliculatus]
MTPVFTVRGERSCFRSHIWQSLHECLDGEMKQLQISAAAAAAAAAAADRGLDMISEIFVICRRSHPVSFLMKIENIIFYVQQLVLTCTESELPLLLLRKYRAVTQRR